MVAWAAWAQGRKGFNEFFTLHGSLKLSDSTRGVFIGASRGVGVSQLAPGEDAGGEMIVLYLYYRPSTKSKSPIIS